MAEEKATPAGKAPGGGMDYSGRPFGYVMPDAETAMICEQDPVIRDKISGELKKMGFLTAQPATYKEALRHMRFHVFNVIFIDEDFDTGVWETNNVLRYLENLNIAVRRQNYVVLISNVVATMDHLEAYSKSANLVINKRDIGSVEKILRQAMAEHDDFYRVFKELIRKS
jgi:DNA-binding NtrC family response regulator